MSEIDLYNILMQHYYYECEYGCDGFGLFCYSEKDANKIVNYLHDIGFICFYEKEIDRCEDGEDYISYKYRINLY